MLNLLDLEQKLSLHGYEDHKIAEIIPKLEEIDRLKEEKQAILLAHYYQIAPIQLIADLKGDSLALAMSAKEAAKGKRMIVSSTVHFMGEMIKLLNPDKKVVVPDLSASCSIAEGMNAATIRRIREFYPESAVVAYINTSAEVKSEVDSVCTSANAEQVMRNITGSPVIMLPDYYFARNVLGEMQKKGLDNKTYLAYRGISSERIILEEMNGREIKIPIKNESVPALKKGVCIVHETFTPLEIALEREKGVDLVLAHPEVKPDVARYADVIGGTKKMIDYLKNKPNMKRILFITECDMAAPLKEAYPDKQFVTPCQLCPYMKKNNLDNIISTLRNERYEINIAPEIELRARKSLNRMFELTGGIK